MPCRPDQLEPGSRRPTIRTGTEAIATPTRLRTVAIPATETVPTTEPRLNNTGRRRGTPVMRVGHLRVCVKHLNETPRLGVVPMDWSCRSPLAQYVSRERRPAPGAVDDLFLTALPGGQYIDRCTWLVCSPAGPPLPS